MTTKAELLKVIRQQCKNCMGGYENEIPICTAPKCSLFPYRMGKDPNPNPNKVKMGKEQALKYGFKAPTDSKIIDEDQREGSNE